MCWRYYLGVHQATKRRLLELVAPLVRGIGFVVEAVYTLALGWWVDPWFQRRANRALLDDVQANFYFLTSQPQTRISCSNSVLPFDYASVEIRSENLLVVVTRGRGDTTVSIAPRDSPQDSYELGPLIAALEHRQLSERDIVNDLAGAANLLRPRLKALNVAFSATEFQHTKQLL